MALQFAELFIERQKQDSIFRSVQVETLKANLENMRRNLALVRQRVENLNVRATVDGQLGLLVPEIGQSISRGANMGQINVLTSYKVTAQIDEHYIDRVRTQLTATLDRQGQRVQPGCQKSLSGSQERHIRNRYGVSLTACQIISEPDRHIIQVSSLGSQKYR